MAGRKIRDEAEARRFLDEAANSGQPRVDWARQHGIDARSLNAWRVNLSRTGKVQRSPDLRLIELVPTSTTSQHSARYRIECGPFVVEVDNDFDMDGLGRLLSLLATC